MIQAHHHQKAAVHIQHDVVLHQNNALLCNVIQPSVMRLSVLKRLLSKLLFADINELDNLRY